MMYRFLTIGLLAGLLAGCGPTEGGKCEYDMQDFVAEVIEVRPDEKREGQFQVVLDFNVSTLATSEQYLSDLKGVETDTAFIERNGIFPGRKYIGTISEIRTGTCKPFFISFNNQFK